MSTTTRASEVPGGPSPTLGGRLPRQPSRSPSPIALTGRGAIVVIFVVGLLGALLSASAGLGLVGGLLFTIGCVLAAVATRQADLLTLAVSPPLIFFVTTLVAQGVHAWGKTFLQSISTGLMLALAAGAPWLFLGTALVVGIAFLRGLTDNVRDLRARLAVSGPGADEGEHDADPVRWDT